jgi:hypothetical protein
MATSPRRRKPAPADLSASDTTSTDAVAAVLADTESAAAAPAAIKRAARKTPAARKRSAATTGEAQAALAAPADAVAASASASEPAADLPADQPTDQSADSPADRRLSRPSRPPRPRRKPEPTATELSQAALAERTTPADDTQVRDTAPATAAEAVADELPAHPAHPAAPTGEAQPEAVAPAATLTPTESVEAPEPPPPPRPATSRLGLADDGLQRLLHWQTGERCPDTLTQAVRRWRLAGLDGPVALGHVDDLAELLAIAARTGHTVDVEDVVWTHLARLGDLQGRIAHLESRHPQGLDPAAQPEGSLLAGWRPCQLEAAFFAACVGRCVLADEAALQPEDELLLAARLVMQHFGASAPVVQAPAEVHTGWQAAWARVHPEHADDTASLTLLTLLTPTEPAPAGTELLVLDQRTKPQPALAESTAAQAAAWLWVLAPADLLDRPEALPLLAAVDQLRQGGLANWQHDGDSASLAPLLLARRFADVAPQWPAWQPAERSTPAPAEEPAAGADPALRLARWQRTGFLADSDQLALRRALHAAWASARAANATALPGLLQEALAAGAGRIVVFSEDATGLPALAEALGALGLPAETLPTAGTPRHAEQALRAFRDAAEPRILLVADAPQGAESRIGVHLAPPMVIHLDTPWAAGALDRRLQRVRAATTQRQVPVWQLLPDGCLMARRARWLATSEADGNATRLDGALLRGPALEAWQAELAALI